MLPRYYIFSYLPPLLHYIFIHAMLKRDYKGKGSDRTLGLKRGKAAIKRETSSVTARKILMWVVLFCLVFFINYLFFVHLNPIKKKQINSRISPREHTMPGNSKEWFDEGYKNYQEGNPEKAVEAFSKVISINSKEARVYLYRGIVYNTMGMYDKAISDYDTAITLNPDYAEAYNNKGWAYLKKEEFNHTIKDCSEALRLNPAMPKAYYTRGVAYQALGLLAKGRKDFQKSCELGDHNGCQAYREVSKVKR
jgi:hypothetical protein